MKFLLVVLAIHFIGEMISNKLKQEKTKPIDDIDEKIIHPQNMN